MKGNFRRPHFTLHSLRSTIVSAAYVNSHPRECVISLLALPRLMVTGEEEKEEEEKTTDQRVVGLIFFSHGPSGTPRWWEVCVRESVGGRVSDLREVPFLPLPLYSVHRV